MSLLWGLGKGDMLSAREKQADGEEERRELM